MQPPLHREARDKRLLTNAAERDVEGAIKAEYEREGLPMPWDEMTKRILSLENWMQTLQAKVDRFDLIDQQLASLEDRFIVLLDQGTAHEKELSAHQTALNCLRADFDLAYLTSLHSLMELVQKQASEIASLDWTVRNLSDQHI